MKLGQKITESRKKIGMKASELAQAIGRSAAIMSDIENDKLKGGCDPEIVVRIATVLNDQSILLHALQENPIYKEIIPRIFPGLNNIKREPSAVFVKLAEELGEAQEAAGILARIFSHAEPETTPNYRETFLANLEQILDVMRGAEELFLVLIDSGIMSVEERREVHERQQLKCERRGHHKRRDEDQP